MSGTPDLAAQVEALRAQIAELAGAVSELRTKLDEGGDQGDGAQEQDPEPDFGKVDLSPLKPFEVQYFFADEEWRIYLPDGCVKVGDEDAEYEAGFVSGSGNMAAITPAPTLYAHVKESSGGASTYTYAIDDEPSDDEAVCDFKVASFDSTLKRVTVQHVSGVVVIGGLGKAAPGCWGIKVDDESSGSGSGSGASARWINQYLMLGANILATNVNDNPVSHKGKFVAVGIPDGSSGAPSVQEYSSAEAMASASLDQSKFVVPLGKLNAEGTGYAIDMRVIPHTTAWDADTAEQSSGSGSAS